MTTQLCPVVPVVPAVLRSPRPALSKVSRSLGDHLLANCVEQKNIKSFEAVLRATVDEDRLHSLVAFAPLGMDRFDLAEAP